MNPFSEENLILQARKALGADVEVLAAGKFSLAHLMVASMGGAGVGAVAGILVDPLDTSGLDEAVGAVVGRRLALSAAAEEAGATVALLLAVTPDDVFVLNGETKGRLPAVFAQFSRATLEIGFKNFGLSRILTLTDTVTKLSIELHGSVSWISATAKGDKVVFDVLGLTEHSG